MTTFLPSVAPPRWEVVRFGSLVTRSKEANRPDLEPLSVFLEAGVVPRSTREDNHNRLGADMSNYLVVQPDDIVFNKLRTWQGGLGVSKYEGVVSPAYFVCRPRRQIDARYYHYLLRSAVYLAELTRLSKFMPPSQFDIAWDDLKTLPVLVPPLVEQGAIADYLDAETARIDALITKKRRLAELLEERFTAEVEIWAEQLAVETSNRLSRVCSIERGRFTHRPRNDPRLYDGNYPFAQTGDIRRAAKRLTVCSQSLNDLGRSTSRSFPDGTILMAIAANVGDVAITTFQTWCPDSVVGFTPASRLDTEFLYYWLLGMRHRVNETSTESTQENTNTELLGSLPIATPAKEEQARYVHSFEALQSWSEDTARLIRTEITLLSERRQALITAAVTGELDVGVAA